MANIQGLILAAGRGSRLGNTNRGMPKCLLEVGRRRLIDHQLDALSDSGVGPITMVLGYGSDEIAELVGIRTEYVHNPRWETTNSLYSFWVAREKVRGPVLILNCDVLFAPAIVNRLLDVEGDALAIDSSSGGGREQMKVRVVDGCLADMGKELPEEQSSGENLGIIKLTAETLDLMFERAGAIVEAGGEKSWLGSALREVCRVRRIAAVDVAGLPWIEIDFPVDLDRARKEIAPAIARSTSGSRRVWKAAQWILAVAALTGTVLAARYSAPPEAPPPVEWEALPLARAQQVQITLGKRPQTWWRMSKGEPSTTTVSGPGPARIESRLLDRPGDDEPYVLEISLDGRRLDWYKLSTRPSGKARHPEWTVSSKKRVTIDIPEGSHELTVRLVAPADGSCLLRVRQINEEGDEG